MLFRSADGVKVKLTELTDYTVTTNNASVKVLASGKGLDVEDLTESVLKDQETAEVKLTFTFTDGNTLEKTVTISKAAPVITTAKLKNDKETVEMNADGAIFTTISSAIEAKDQYGVEDKTSAIKPNVTVTDLSDKDDDGSLSVTNNGLPGAAFVGLEKGDTATIKLTYPGGYVFTTKFVSTSTATINPADKKELKATNDNVTLSATAGNEKTMTIAELVEAAEITAKASDGTAINTFTVSSISETSDDDNIVTTASTGNIITVASTATDGQSATVEVTITCENGLTKVITVNVSVSN